jgi:hypothetical protein
MKLEVTRPQSKEVFESCIKTIATERHRAMHLLFDSIEADILEKEKFVST